MIKYGPPQQSMSGTPMAMARALGQVLSPKGHRSPYQWGVVSAVGGAGHTCSVQLDGSATATPGIRYLASYVPVVNDVVLVCRGVSGPSDRVIVNKLSVDAAVAPYIWNGTWTTGQSVANNTTYNTPTISTINLPFAARVKGDWSATVGPASSSYQSIQVCLQIDSTNPNGIPAQPGYTLNWGANAQSASISGTGFWDLTAGAHTVRAQAIVGGGGTAVTLSNVYFTLVSGVAGT